MRVSASFAARSFLLCLLCLGSVTCGPKGLLAPFVDVVLTKVPADATQLQVDATFAGKTKTELSSNSTLDHFTISLPNDTREKLDLQATVRNAQNCIVATGQLSVNVAENQLYQLQLELVAQTPPICPGGGLVPLTVTKTGFGGGNIVSMPASLTCDNTCTTRMAELQAGTVVTLNVDMLASGAGWTSTFDGWSGACSGTTTCFVTLAQASMVTARFSCHGWCPESSPAVTSNLNAIWAFSPQRIVAVGDGGRILQWDSNSWKNISSPVTTNLRSIHGVSGGIGFAVGDTGTILKTVDSGTNWTVMSSGTTLNLRAVWANDATTVYAVGDNIMTGKPWLNSNGTAWGQENLSNVDFTWNAIWGYATVDYFVVGEMGKTVIRNPFNIPASVTANQLNGLFGTSRDSMTAVGLGSTILRLSNTTWNVMNKPAGTGFVILRAIHGTADNQMFAVGDSGTVWFNKSGSTWAVESFPVTTQLNGVHVLAPTELYVVGAGGLIYHKKP
jgi:photosystem II stability/assembly factor-like uncharacterized protein